MEESKIKEIDSIHAAIKHYLEKNKECSLIFASINPTEVKDDLQTSEISTLIKGDNVRILLDKLSFVWADDDCDD